MKISFQVEVEDVSQQIGIPGIVRNVVVVPQSNEPLPEGSHVEIRLQPSEMPSALRKEIEAWDKASDDSWSWIKKLELDEKLGLATFIESNCRNLPRSEQS